MLASPWRALELNLAFRQVRRPWLSPGLGDTHPSHRIQFAQGRPNAPERGGRSEERGMSCGSLDRQGQTDLRKTVGIGGSTESRREDRYPGDVFTTVQRF